MKAKILLLEDEEALGKIYKFWLDKYGYEAIWTKTAEDTRKVAKKFKADLVLLDHAIKGRSISGLDIVKNLKETLPKSKLVILSNYDRCHLENEKNAEYIDDYLLKVEFTPSKLISYMEKILI